MSVDPRPRGYLLLHQDWYEIPGEDDPLSRHASISTLEPDAFVPAGEAQLLKHCFEVREVTDVTPQVFSIAECEQAGQSHYESFEEACDFLRTQGVDSPQVGYNPVAWTPGA